MRELSVFFKHIIGGVDGFKNLNIPHTAFPPCLGKHGKLLCCGGLVDSCSTQKTGIQLDTV